MNNGEIDFLNSGILPKETIFLNLEKFKINKKTKRIKKVPESEKVDEDDWLILFLPRARYDHQYFIDATNRVLGNLLEKGDKSSVIKEVLGAFKSHFQYIPSLEFLLKATENNHMSKIILTLGYKYGLFGLETDPNKATELQNKWILY